MRYLLRKLRSEKKILGSHTFPVGHHEGRRRPIVAGIDLNRVEDLGVHPKIVSRLSVSWIEWADPVLVGPAAAPNPQPFRAGRQSPLEICYSVVKEFSPGDNQNIGVLENTIPCCVIW